jgi:DNA-binding MarR family transcriptional regulator
MAAAPGSSGELPLEGVRADLGWALGTVLRAYARSVQGSLAGLPGGPRGYQVLSASVHDRPETQIALAQRLGIDRTVLTYLLDDLAEAGLVERQPDPNDRRSRRIVATDGGRARLCELDRALRASEEQVLSALDVRDREQLRQLLQRVAIDVAQGVANPCDAVDELGIDRRD